MFKFRTFAIPWNKCCFRQVAQDDRIKLGLHCHSQTKSIFIRKTTSSEALTLAYVSYRQQGLQIMSYVTHLHITLTSEDSRNLMLLPNQLTISLQLISHLFPRRTCAALHGCGYEVTRWCRVTTPIFYTQCPFFFFFKQQVIL